MRRDRPVRRGIGRKILILLLPAAEREALLGDMDEIQTEIAARLGSVKALRWQWRQLLRLALSSLMDSIVWRISMIKNFWKMNWRNLKKQPGYTAINIAGLAIGLTCCLVILIWVRGERSFDRFHASSDRLFRVFTLWEKGQYGTYLPAPLAAHLEREFPEIARATVFADVPNTKVSFSPDKSLMAAGTIVEPSFFEMFTFPFIKGNPRTAFASPTSVVITESLAERLFGGQDPVGRSLRLNDGQTDFAITGVLRRLPIHSSLKFDLLIPYAAAPARMKSWDINSTPIYVRLRDGASQAEVDRKIAGVINARNPEHKNTLGLQPLTDVRLHELEGGGRIVYVYILSAMALVIILIAAVNFTNLSTARSERRVREIGIKKVLGSSRGQLVQQFLSESVLLAFLSLLVAAALAKVLIPAVNTLLDQPMELRFSWSLAGTMAAFTLFVGFLSGSYPAFLLSSIQPLAAFKGRRLALRKKISGCEKAQARAGAMRKMLVVAQLVLSIFFIFAVVVINRQMGFIRAKALGFDKDNVIVLSLQGNLVRNGQVLKNRILAIPEVLSAAVARNDLDGWTSSSSPEWSGKQPGEHTVLGLNWVDGDYLKALKLEMSEGRFFNPDFPSDPASAVVINEAAAKAMGMTRPLGQRLSIPWGEKFERTVIGVVRDFHTESLHAPVRPYALFFSGMGPRMFIRIAPGDVPKTLKAIERTVKTIVPDDPFLFRFLDEILDRLYFSEQTMGKLIALTALMALLISCLGLFGLVSYMAERRSKEIGIRKVLGATTAGIVGLFLKEIVLGIGLAAVLAAPLSLWAAEKWLRSFAFRISISPWMILASGSLVLIVAVLTVLYQTLKAAATDPVETIHYE